MQFDDEEIEVVIRNKSPSIITQLHLVLLSAQLTEDGLCIFRGGPAHSRLSHAHGR
jgi:hypothetical protein